MAFLRLPSVRRITAALAATATALALMTATPTPVRADTRSDDLAKAIAALAAIAIIGSALNEKDNKRDHRATIPQPPRYYEKPRGHRHRHRHDYQAPRHDYRAALRLPAQCAIEVRSRRHTTVAYTERCLRHAGIDQRLPRQCAISIGRHGRDRTAYDQNCLLNSGFRMQREGRN